MKASIPPERAPHVVVVGVWVGRSFPWTRTARGFDGRLWCLYGGWCYQDEANLGRRFSGQHSLRAKKCWLLGKRPTVVGGSPIAPLATSPVTSGAGSWRFLNRKVDLAFTWLTS